jgi:ketosteroid isomerase-like protein
MIFCWAGDYTANGVLVSSMSACRRGRCAAIALVVLLQTAHHSRRIKKTRDGGEPVSSDIDELTALNRDYVASVQNCDVKRFDQILAQEFYCSNPDKSLVDRAAFLKQTALPVTIKNLRAEDVKVRVLGDFAIIHAATSYTTADGQQAHGRYTDCWAKQNGRWLAVSAHVSR